MAALAACLIGSGTGKWGWPMLRLTGSFSLAARSKTMRIPETSIWRILSAIQCSCMTAPVNLGKSGNQDIIANRDFCENLASGGQKPIEHSRLGGLTPSSPQFCLSRAVAIRYKPAGETGDRGREVMDE